MSADITLPEIVEPAKVQAKQVLLVANGDLRLAANQHCWPAQAQMEDSLHQAVNDAGFELVRAHPFKPEQGHGFIDSQKEGWKSSRASIPMPRSSWPRRSGNTPITFCRPDHAPGTDPHRGQLVRHLAGLVGMLNLNGSLTKAGVAYSTLWSEDFTDELFPQEPSLAGSTTAECVTDTTRRTCWRIKNAQVPLPPRNWRKALADASCSARRRSWASSTKAAWACSTRSFPTNCCTPPASSRSGSASRLALRSDAASQRRRSARGAATGCEDSGMKFNSGKNEETDLTEAQILQQCKMYIAAVRIADEFGCATIGIQYQQGLKDLAPASDLVEGMLNNVDRPPVTIAMTGRRSLWRRGAAALQRSRRMRRARRPGDLSSSGANSGYPPENTLHDLRWGRASIRTTRRRLRLGVPHLRRRAAGAFHRRLARARRASASRRCISASAAARSRASASRARLSGAASSCRGWQAEVGPGPGRSGRVAAGRNRAALASRPRRNGRSCTPCFRASRATR